MKIILVAAESLDGKITRGNEEGTQSWTSQEDKKLFSSFLKKSRLVVMGRKTYDAAREKMKFDLKTLRVVITRNPKKYSRMNISGKLEFTDETPRQLISRFEKNGYEEMLLVGGGEINSLFLKESLIDELRLTIEPLIFGKGKSLFSGSKFKANLKLLSSQKLNKNGTLYLVYKLLK